MRHRYALLLASILIAVPVAAVAQPSQRTCGTPPLTSAQSQLFETIRERLENGTQSVMAGGSIAVAFHVIHNGATGNVPQAQIDAQMAVLNQDFADCGYQFVLLSTDRTNNAGWHVMTTLAEEIAITNALAVDPAHTINIYLCNLGNSILGFAYYPGSFVETSKRNAVFVDYRTLPGGVFVPYDLGRTLTHEVGHHLGMAHTFENGCDAPGDYVADTPDEADPAFGCPVGLDTCPTAGADPIHNYMDYTDDACMTEFTPGQCEFAAAQLAFGRPSLVVGGPTPAKVSSWGAVKQHYR